jgi:catechol-2,3-dioxygenase
MAPTFSNPGKTVLPPSRLAHIVLKTSPKNFEPVLAFYKTFLNASANYESFEQKYAFITYDEEHHRLGLVGFPNVSGSVETTKPGLVHTAFGYDNLHDLALAYRQRKEHGIVPHACVNHGPTTSLYYRDPDGSEIETFTDNMGVEAARANMETEAFAENPMGTYFDPENLVNRLEAGEDEESIKIQANMDDTTGRFFVKAH